MGKWGAGLRCRRLMGEWRRRCGSAAAASAESSALGSDHQPIKGAGACGQWCSPD